MWACLGALTIVGDSMVARARAVWYVMDELGSAVRHSDRPTALCMPFMYLPDGTLNSAVR